jgi:hypothetical protein
MKEWLSELASNGRDMRVYAITRVLPQHEGVLIAL